MDGAKIDEIDFTNHKSKCRICFKLFGTEEHRVEINKRVEKRFRDLMQTDVRKQQINREN